LQTNLVTLPTARSAERRQRADGLFWQKHQFRRKKASDRREIFGRPFGRVWDPLRSLILRPEHERQVRTVLGVWPPSRFVGVSQILELALPILIFKTRVDGVWNLIRRCWQWKTRIRSKKCRNGSLTEWRRRLNLLPSLLPLFLLLVP
jgi:hypothetical protein